MKISHHDTCIGQWTKGDVTWQQQITLKLSTPSLTEDNNFIRSWNLMERSFFVLNRKFLEPSARRKMILLSDLWDLFIVSRGHEKKMRKEEKKVSFSSF